MASAAFRGLVLLALACASSVRLDAENASSRVAPARPGTSVDLRTISGATVRLGGTDYVRLDQAAARLGLKVAASERGRVLTLTGAGTSAVIEADTRDIQVNGLRVFLGNPSALSRGKLYVSRIDFERCLAPLLRPGVGVPRLRPPKVIALDPGHGGRDHGKVNDALKVNEKSLTLDTARRLKQLLEADGYRVVLTRDDDRFLELPDRPAAASAAGADLFISIHYNALDRDRRTSGVEIFTFAPQHQRSTQAWMPGEKDDTERQPEPGNVYDYWNAMLAHALHRPFVRDLKASDRGKKLMHAGVLRSLRCPGALVECGFLSSDVEARKIATPAYRQQIAEALRAGVRAYADQLNRISQGPTKTSARSGASHSS
ncbi:N-acetylmuramoyl-L-alanine amidase [Opitutus sp. ER46]|uniref:N-acetylmuramoyl-L-alanine amidase family protein n=1 Tax=Opitutus sp. ER46 TaxID=2161864 RepID=UPI000D324FF1|nr:N-acetylmuramoyl-L-alanine amidase [Opitutus sp. ER46]PTX97801.1 hypothetical protein DB354_05855 [Opitutus sp. ER46]